MAGTPENATRVQLSKLEWANLAVNDMARMGLTPEEYFTKKDAGEIDCADHPAVMDISMTLELRGKSARRDLLALTRKTDPQ